MKETVLPHWRHQTATELMYTDDAIRHAFGADEQATDPLDPA